MSTTVQSDLLSCCEVIRRIRALANNSVTDSLEASFEASGAHPSLFGAIRLYTTERLHTLSVVAIRLPICYNRIAKILKVKLHFALRAIKLHLAMAHRQVLLRLPHDQYGVGHG
jgi:hypothetical protein